MSVLLLLATGILTQVEPPRTVNGQVLGPVEEYQTDGPARVCLNDIAIDIVEGEKATLQYAGIHSGQVRLTRDNGFIDVVHGDAWARSGGKGKVILERSDFSVRRLATGKDLKYGLFAPRESSGGKLRMVAHVSGPALNGSSRDLTTLQRILRVDDATTCKRRYAYGWGMLFGDEPLSTGDKK